MIFLTIGTQLPFNRLIKAIDDWNSRNPQVEIFGQIANSDYIPTNFGYKRFITPSEYNYYLTNCSLVISHAGMGSIISALSVQKPIIVMARDADRGEHRNQHQISTVQHFSNINGCYGCYEVSELYNLLHDYKNLSSGMLNNENDIFSDILTTEIAKIL